MNFPATRTTDDEFDTPDPASAGWYGVPVVPASYVRRPRLLEVMERADAARLPLVLVSGPAGSGKTSMVADWVAARGDTSGTQWVTFEAGEESFWPGVVGGLARLGVDVPPGCDPSGVVRVARRELTALAAAVAGHPRRMTLVLDGYELTSPEIAGDLDFLMRHTGRRLGLVMVTRVDPVLPLYRYRLEETVVEVRMADLAFTDDEAAGLMRAAGVDLAAESVQALNGRTEGWVAGLKFASVFLAAQSDPDRAVSEVAGDTGNIASFLMGEVLASQTPATRTLLLRTSVPDVIQPGLAEKLAGESATRTLEALSTMNVFVEPVPEHPDFYRYHPFFRDLLRAELAYESMEELHLLHRLAAEWLAEDGQLTAAVSHLVDVGAWDEAAGQVVDDLAVAELLVGVGDSPLARVLRAIPAHVEGNAASIVRATLALADNDTDRCNEELAKVAGADEVPQDDHERAVAVAVAVLRAVRARTVSDTVVAAELADEAHAAVASQQEDRRVAEHPELSTLIQVSRGMASLRRGRLDEAEAFFDLGAQATPGSGGLQSLRVECLGYLALIAALRDQLKRARSLAARAVAVADEAGLTPAERPPGAQIALAVADVEQCRMLDAHEHARLAEASAYPFGEPVTSALLSLVRARLDGATGHVRRALATVEEAGADLVDPSGWLAVILRIEAGRLRASAKDPAAALAAVEGLATRQPAAVAGVVAQVHLVAGDVAAAHLALAPALETSAPVHDRVVAWLLEAECQLRRGRRDPAGAALDRALRLAAKERLRRPFREAPHGIAAMLSASSDPSLGWLQMPASRARPAVPGQRTAAPPGLPVTPADVPLVVEHLTDKELQVLGLLAELLTTEEIADALFVSVNTIRTHVRSILRKLGVSRRNAAVRRARELQLLPL